MQRKKLSTLYAFNSKGEYGITHRLSTSMSPFHTCMVANLPPSFADLLYKGYSSFLVTVMDINARGCSVYRKFHSLAIKTYLSHRADENMPAQAIIISWVVPECKNNFNRVTAEHGIMLYADQEIQKCYGSMAYGRYKRRGGNRRFRRKRARYGIRVSRDVTFASACFDLQTRGRAHPMFVSAFNLPNDCPVKIYGAVMWIATNKDCTPGVLRVQVGGGGDKTDVRLLG
ncbi:unnamed protein product [Onchocerca ochengi]|uniref:Nuclear shuttle protein n=1 Tax=Onchocerca ochengi TaxID=42157 RepID=A0A182EQP5_ONCOC|nr:unnamed protein product [Onchocerca ochengi]